MSGIYNIGHCVMTWSISNCEQGSGTKGISCKSGLVLVSDMASNFTNVGNYSDSFTILGL